MFSFNFSFLLIHLFSFFLNNNFVGGFEVQPFLSCCQLHQIGFTCKENDPIQNYHCQTYCEENQFHSSSSSIVPVIDSCPGENGTVFATFPNNCSESFSDQEKNQICWKRITMIQKNVIREFSYYVPNKCLNEDDVCGVIFFIHGLKGSPSNYANIVSDLINHEAEGNGIKDEMVFVVPTGYQLSWNGGECCGDSNFFGLNDTLFIFNAIIKLREELGHAIDPNMIFMAGFSNGGFFTSKFVQEYPKLLKGAVIVAGHTYKIDNILPHSSIPVAIYWSKMDTAVSFNGCCTEEYDSCCCGLSKTSPNCSSRIGFYDIVDKWANTNECEKFQKVIENDDGICQQGVNCLNEVLYCTFEKYSHTKTARVTFTSEKYYAFYFFRKIACEVNGELRDLKNNEYICDCKPGWKGSLCLMNHDNLIITNDNLTITNDNLTITNDNLTITNDNLNITNDNLTITNNNLNITNDNLTITNDNLTITNNNFPQEENISPPNNQIIIIITTQSILIIGGVLCLVLFKKNNRQYNSKTRWEPIPEL